MCIQTNYRSKSTRPATPKKSLRKQLDDDCSTSSSNSSSSTTNTASPAPPSPTSIVDVVQVQRQQQQSNGKKKRRKNKNVSFNEVVMVRPHEYDYPEEKSVAFHEVVMVRPVLHLSDYSDKEIADSWYVLADKQRIKIDILNTLKQAKEQASTVNTRGLEKLTDGGRTRERRRLSIREILEEQESQKEAHKKRGCSGEPFVYDESKFRKTYKPHSRAARHVAHAVAKMDELAGKQTPHQCTRKCKPRKSSVCPIAQAEAVVG